MRTKLWWLGVIVGVTAVIALLFSPISVQLGGKESATCTALWEPSAADVTVMQNTTPLRDYMERESPDASAEYLQRAEIMMRLACSEARVSRQTTLMLVSVIGATALVLTRPPRRIAGAATT